MLSPIQKEIVELPGNLIVRASAGTGKTHTMVSKIEYDIAHCHTHKAVAAITFTIKAAAEIKDRLTIDTSNHFIGTNNSFAIEEIIKPFMRDVFGKDYKLDMSTDYSVKVKTFTEGLSKVKDEQILCSYANSKENFIFQLALEILQKSKACQLYLKAKYFKIYVDEYQDCDKDMHALFMYICENLKIDTFVVGDEKQSIYMWRGAYPKAFMSIWGRDDFSKKFMRDNFRSCQQIQNYSNLLCDETRDLYKTVDDLSSVIVICTATSNWVSSVTQHLDPDKKCALLRYSKANAEAGAKALTDGNMEFTYIPQTPISEITTDAKRIAITFHSSKGLEFEQVVLFVSDYRLSSEEDIYNHYVAATRAKTKLILVYINGDWSAGQFAKNINNILGKSGLKMKDVATIVNCTECINN